MFPVVPGESKRATVLVDPSFLQERITMQGDSAPSRPSEGSHPRILVVDDEESLCRAITRILESAGFDVNAAQDGAQAMQLLDEHSFDAVLTDVAMPGMDGIALLRAVRERDLEVPVVLMTGKPDVESAAEAIRYGACEYLFKPIPNAELESTIRRAVSMSGLARAKRDSIRVLDTGRPEAGDRAGLEVTLDRALDSMWMAYQPIVEAATRTLFGYEALLRSSEPTLPHPGAVLDAAERLGRLDDVGRAVRRKAPEPMHSVPPPALLFVNLHASDLNDEALTSPSAPLTSIAPRVVLEITERASLESVSDARSRVAQLRELGFRIAIDDLGAGYAGLTSFAQLEPEFVKLDMSLVRDVHKNPIKRKLVRSMTALCKDLGIVVVAEGIEVAEERDTIIELGSDLLQGYLFAKPGRAFPEVCWG
jgi:EAL domain-containing protein (putative c-di-GMP-specific phosphodiesterase class I)